METNLIACATIQGYWRRSPLRLHLFELLPLVTMAIRAYFRDRPSDF